MNNILVFDGTFDGLLTAVFDTYLLHIPKAELLREDSPIPLFHTSITRLQTDCHKSDRVMQGLTGSLSSGMTDALVTAFLTNDKNNDNAIFNFIVRVFGTPAAHRRNLGRDFSDPDLLTIIQNCRKVRREAHRMIQFVRFQKAIDGTYFSMIEPEYDILPMIMRHFNDRFSDQQFIIYDRKRDYGFFYKEDTCSRITISGDGGHLTTGRLDEELSDKDERLFQSLWRTYFKSIAISERANPRKQRQDMPRRYWKYLTEIQE